MSKLQVQRPRPLRFVLLRHEMPAGSSRGSHFDLMLEDGDGLRTWAIERDVDMDQSETAVELSRHRLEYLNYEGELSGGRGTVNRIVSGKYTVVDSQSGKLCIQIDEGPLAGELNFVRLEDQQDGQLWTISRRVALANR